MGSSWRSLLIRSWAAFSSETFVAWSFDPVYVGDHTLTIDHDDEFRNRVEDCADQYRIYVVILAHYRPRGVVPIRSRVRSGARGEMARSFIPGSEQHLPDPDTGCYYLPRAFLAAAAIS